MLITFKSKAASDVIMYKEHAKRILDLLGKNVMQGVITTDETRNAIAILEKEIEQTKLHSAAEDLRHDVEAHHGDFGDDKEHEPTQLVSFATRVYPLLEMLRAAQKDGYNVAWGI
ncbi:MAG: hypothetical protein JWQ21_3623 [Herminiimonas sp.]|nr:hypothetical protein [Herminiimonas sp.]